MHPAAKHTDYGGQHLFQTFNLDPKIDSSMIFD